MLPLKMSGLLENSMSNLIIEIGSTNNLKIDYEFMNKLSLKLIALSYWNFFYEYWLHIKKINCCNKFGLELSNKYEIHDKFVLTLIMKFRNHEFSSHGCEIFRIECTGRSTISESIRMVSGRRPEGQKVAKAHYIF